MSQSDASPTQVASPVVTKAFQSQRSEFRRGDRLIEAFALPLTVRAHGSAAVRPDSIVARSQGRTFRACPSKVRGDRAERLLRESPPSIRETVAAWGGPLGSAFVQRFKRVCAETPGRTSPTWSHRGREQKSGAMSSPSDCPSDEEGGLTDSIIRVAEVGTSQDEGG